MSAVSRLTIGGGSFVSPALPTTKTDFDEELDDLEKQKETTDALILSLRQEKLTALGEKFDERAKEIFRQQTKITPEYDSILGYGWGTRAGLPWQRMRFREFILFRSDPSNPDQIAARPTHLIAYKRMASWPMRYPQGTFKLDAKGNDTPANFGALWMRQYDDFWDKNAFGEHINGPKTASENFPRLERIYDGIAV